MSNSIPFQPSAGSGKTIAVTTSSGEVSLDAVGATVYVFNAGSSGCFIRIGEGAQTAVVTTDMYIHNGTGFFLSRQRWGDIRLAAITASGSTTLYICGGDGS